MYVIKYFYEEPFHLEEEPRAGAPSGLASFLDRGRPVFRGYLAGSRLEPRAVGLTAVPAEAFRDPLLDVFGRADWHVVDGERGIRTVEADDIADLMADPAGVEMVWQAAERHDDLALAASAAERIEKGGALLPLLESARAALFPEPAHDGFDFSLFAPSPVKDRLVEAFRRHPSASVRRFVLPYQRARAEERFYFEFWQLDDLPEHVTEV